MNIKQLKEEIDLLRDIINTQAEDEGLWFIAETASESYLKIHLRDLHRVVEDFIERFDRINMSLSEEDDARVIEACKKFGEKSDWGDYGIRCTKCKDFMDHDCIFNWLDSGVSPDDWICQDCYDL